ncbi:prepilin peptidase [Motilimonas pumila]|uniref:Prepilin leader peptidase/N-methyltransferase n=1 Tax=Motilimonas pumila TaxID=2303987 RepID=A0A418YI44_9GAMM|nr:A24 family peptidase [Motilimonas pumila]RJG50048.1 prepilin peptidase [Motilimonas pumila]
MTEILLLLQGSLWALCLVVLCLGLLVGSFLNVVIHRLPKMMQAEWRSECRAFLEDELKAAPTKEEKPKYNLVVPRSACPQCGHKITALENIPIISWLCLKGKCSECKTPISARYPSIELLTGLMSLAVAFVVPFGWPLLAALVLTWTLIALTFIDFDTMLLPDNMTLPLLWLGLIVNFNGSFATLEDAVIGAMAGYLSLWSIYWAFKILTKKEGMGYGDFKLLAALGAWFGWQALPLIILLSSFVGAIVGISLMALAKNGRGQPIPFGPYLAAAGWIYLVYGEQLIELYYRFLLG